MMNNLTSLPFRKAAFVLMALLLVVLGGCASPPPEAPVAKVPLVLTHWYLTSIKEQPLVLAQGQGAPYVRLLDERNLEGFGGCNRFNGAYETQMAWLRFNSIAVTRMACAAPMNEMESAFLAALEQGAVYLIARNQLKLLDYKHNVILTFASTAPAVSH